VVLRLQKEVSSVHFVGQRLLLQLLQCKLLHQWHRLQHRWRRLLCRPPWFRCQLNNSPFRHQHSHNNSHNPTSSNRSLGSNRSMLHKRNNRSTLRNPSTGNPNHTLRRRNNNNSCSNHHTGNRNSPSTGSNPSPSTDNPSHNTASLIRNNKTHTCSSSSVRCSLVVPCLLTSKRC